MCYQKMQKVFADFLFNLKDRMSVKKCLLNYNKSVYVTKDGAKNRQNQQTKQYIIFLFG